jgi:hypothetical protein
MEYDSIELQEDESLRKNPDGTVTLIMANGSEHTYDPEQVFPREEF